MARRLRALGVTHVERLFVQNEDEDHLNGFPDLQSAGMIRGTLTNRNWALDVREVGRQKRLRNGSTSHAWDAWEEYARGLGKADPHSERRVLGRQNDCQAEVYAGQLGTPAETNNSSLVVVLEVRGSRIVLPGDMEEKGWNDLILCQPRILNAVNNCEAFVAAHHGRKDGYHEGIMRAANPGVVVMSDKSVVHGTQEGMPDKYGRHAQGQGQIAKILLTSISFVI